MKALANVFVYIKHGVNVLFDDVQPKSTACEPREIMPASSYTAFMALCIDMGVRGNRAMYQDYLDAYHQNVNNGYDGLRAYEFLNMHTLTMH